MDKIQLLALLEQKIQAGEITRNDIEALSFGHQSENKNSIQSKNLTNILYVIGALIVVIGAVILLGQNWQEIGFVGRVLSTLGIACVTFVLGWNLNQSAHRVLSQVFFAVAGILAPVGIIVLLREFNVVFGSAMQICTALLLFVLFFCAYNYTKRNTLIIWNMLWLSWAYLAFIEYLFVTTPFITKWASIVLGLAYLCVGYFVQKNIVATERDIQKEKSFVYSLIYGAGAMMIVIPALFMSGFFDLITLLIIFGLFYLSVYVQSRFVLVISGISLIAYILKITSKYFVDSIGWPVALIGIGFLIIAIGYGTLYISRTYIAKNTI